MALTLLSVALDRADAAEKWGPFHGRIVDAETGEAIPGVAVLVVWWEHVPNPVQGQRRFFDARETVTDADGRFTTPRLSPPFFGFRILPADIALFAPGYVEQSERVTPPGGQPFVDPTEIRLRRLRSRAELDKKSRARPGGVPDDKMPGYLRSINIERAMLGLGPIEPTPEGKP
ncbi:MAG: hypothetical protein ACREK6_17780 [Candidatus Rokuibacteriota bacterium]